MGHAASVALYHTAHHGQRLNKRSPTAAVLDIPLKSKDVKFGFLLCLDTKLCPKLKKVLKEGKTPLIKKALGKLILKPSLIKLPLGKYTKKDKKYDKKKDKKTLSYITDPCIIPRKFIKSGILAVIACPLPNPIADIG